MNNNSPPEAKIALFRGLFRGRDDVYPRRFESRKTGRSGYQPACDGPGAQKKGLKLKPESLVISGAPGGIRTPDQRIRSPLLYPAELLVQNGSDITRPARGAQVILRGIARKQNFFLDPIAAGSPMKILSKPQTPLLHRSVTIPGGRSCSLLVSSQGSW